MQFAFRKFDFYNSKEPPREIQKTCYVNKRQVNGRNVFTLKPKTAKSNIMILYFHGGAYVQNFVKQHWKFLAMLVANTHCTIISPDYPLAPAHTYVDVFEMIIPMYKELLAEGTGKLILMGDSAGGGLALALAQKMNIEGVTQPHKIILLSPWLDVTLSNPEIKNVDHLDPFLGVAGLRKAGFSYAGSTDLQNFMVSPIFGSLDQLGPISLFIGAKDIFVADARKLKSMLSKKGISMNYREYPDMVHVWMLLNFRESKLARQEIVSLILENV